jgi:hypothetical protein
VCQLEREAWRGPHWKGRLRAVGVSRAPPRDTTEVGLLELWLKRECATEAGNAAVALSLF